MDQVTISWLDDYNMVQDAVPVAVATVLGYDKVCQLAQRAEEQGDWWAAALRWSAAARCFMPNQPLLKHSCRCLSEVRPRDLAQERRKDWLELTNVLAVLMKWNPGDMPEYMPRLAAVCLTDVVKEDAESVARGIHVTQYYPFFFADHCDGGQNISLFGQGGYKHCMALIEPALALPLGSFRRTLLLAEAQFSSFAFIQYFQLVQPNCWDDICGENGSILIELHEHYNLETMNKRVAEIVSWDSCLSGGIAWPLVMHYGSLTKTSEILDAALCNIKLLRETPNGELSFDMLMSTFVTTPLLACMGRYHEAVDLMRETGVDWEHVDETTIKFTEAIMLMGEPPAVISPHAFKMCMRVQYALLLWLSNRADKAQLEHFVSTTLPSVHEYAMLGFIQAPEFMIGPCNCMNQASWVNMYFLGLLYAKLDMPELALECCHYAVEPNTSKGGGSSFDVQSNAHRLRGQLLAQRGEPTAAEQAFEAAAAVATPIGLTTLEALAVRDLIAYVLEPAQRAVSAGRARLAKIMAQLALTEGELNAML